MGRPLRDSSWYRPHFRMEMENNRLLTSPADVQSARHRSRQGYRRVVVIEMKVYHYLLAFTQQLFHYRR